MYRHRPPVARILRVCHLIAVEEVIVEIGGATVAMDRTVSADSNVNSNSSRESVGHAKQLVTSSESVRKDFVKRVVSEVTTDGLISAPTTRPD